MRRPLSLSIVILSIALVSSAATVPHGFIETTISGPASPTAMAFAPDGRLFVCEHGGSLRVIRNGALLAAPFVTLTVDSIGERGLLGVAIDPAFDSNQFLYLYYTATSPTTHNRISRFTASGDVAVPASELPIMDLDDLSATNHNGGAIHFGPDGKLYAAVGENANGPNSQTLANRLGKMHRINSDGTIPTDNPFFATATGVNRSIWALGLRNPFTFAFQRGTTRMFINDVGAGTWEEINDGIAGSNYGWPATEGMTTNPLFRSPLFAYPHAGAAGTSGCAITGGAFYNPAVVQFTDAFIGKYFFAELCNGWIRLFDPGAGTAEAFATGASQPVDLHAGPDGSLFYLGHTGVVSRIRSAVSNRNRDLNSDGRADIVWHNDATGDSSVWFMSGTSLALSAALPPVVNPDWKIAGNGDFQDDGRADILWRNTTTGDNSLWLMNGSSIALGVALPSLAAAWKVAAAGDLNGDAKSDIVWRNTVTGQNLVWLMNGGNVTQASSLPSVSSTQWDVAAAADFQGDGKADLFWRNGATGDNALWLMNGAAVASSATLTAVPDTAWAVAGSGDVNGDGNADIIWRNGSTGDNSIWFMNGASIAASSTLPSVPNANWRIARVADFQNDGRSDLFWRNQATGDDSVWLMNGASVAASATLPSVPDPNWSPAGR
ncbi:MAG: PQQ-dependent sugar dehydrogenase [Thermoanaerobaculia bacterium]